MKNKYFLLFLAMFMSIVKIYGQNITINSADMPPNVVACGDPATFKVNVFGPLASGTVITTALPTGAKFNSLVSGNVTATPTSSGVNFTLTSALASASDQLTITYTVDTPCSPNVSGNVVYTTGAITKSVVFPTVQYSLLEVTTVTPPSATISVLGTQNYTYTVKQSADTYSNNIKVFITHSTKVSITTTVGTLTLGTPSGTTQTDVLELTGAQIATIGDNDTKFEKDETFTGTITAKLLSCTSGETISFKAGYGCGTTTACQTGNTTSVGLVGNTLGDPKLTMTQSKKPWPGFQTSDADNATFVLKNTGTGPALGVKVQLGFAYNGYVPAKRTYLDFYNATVGTTPMTDDAQDVLQFNFTSDPDGIGVGLDDLDGDGFYNDLPAGQSVTINAMLRQTLNTMNETCRPGYYNGAGTSGVDTTRWRLINKNSCGADLSFNETNDTLGTNTPFTVGVINQTGDINAPNGNVNFVAGSTFSAVYSFGANATSPSSGNGFSVNASGTFWRLKMVLPPGVVPSGTPTYSDAKYVVTYNSTVSSPSTNTYYYDLVPSNTNQGQSNLGIAGKVNIPLVVDGSCNNNGIFNIRFSAALYRDASNVFIPELGCATSPNFSLGCGSVTGLGIDSFDLKRQTFGYLNVAGTQQAVESDITGGELNNYLNGDKAVAAYKLTLVDPTIKSAVLNFEYDQYNWLQPNLANGGIKGISGSYTNPNTNVTTTFTIAAGSLANYYTYTTSYTGADGKLKSGYTFDVMKLFQAGGPLAAITPVAGAKINYNINFTVNQDLYDLNANTTTDSNQGYSVTGMQTYPTIVLANNSTVTGNIKTDKAIVFSYYVTNEISAPTVLNIEQCQEVSYEVSFFFSKGSGKYGDLFTKEYRYNARIDKFEMLVPAGVTLVPGTATQNARNITINIADPTITYGFNADGTTNPQGLYDKYVFTNPGTWNQQDATYNAGFDIQKVAFKIMPNNLYRAYYASNTTFKTTVQNGVGNYSLNFDTPRTLVTAKSNSTPITYNLQNYTVSSAAANPTTATNSVSWPLTITNQSTSALTNFWVAIEVPNNNLTPTLWDGATQIPMVSYGTGKYWAKVGNIPVGSKTFMLRSNSFTICGTDSFKVKTSFECQGYPTDPAQGFPTQGNRTLWTQDINMSITTQNPTLTISSSVNASGNQSFTICDPIDETLTVTNGANGYAYKIEPNISFPTGMQFVAGSFKVNYNGVDYAIADPTLVSGNTFMVNIYSNPSLPFVTTGLPGTSNTVDPKTFVIKYKVATVCYSGGVGNYISGSRIGYNVPYQSGCQTQMTPLTLNSNPIELGGGLQGKTYVNSLITLENPNNVGNHHINDGEEMRVTIINQGDAVSSLETIKVFVDAAYDYVPNSYVLQSGNNFSGMPAINEPTSAIDATGKRQIVWTIPTGFTSANGSNTIQFDFKLKVVNPAALNCASTNEVIMNTYIGTTLTCAINGQSCSLEYPTGTNQKVNLNAFKPSITATVANSSFINNAGTTNYTINYTITDTNTTYEVKPQLKLMLYNDANNNGVVDAGEQLLDTQYSTITVAPSGNASGVMTGSFTGTAQNYVLVIDSNPTVSDICAPVALAIKSYCYKPGILTGIALDTKHGITALGRAGSSGDNWPMVRKGAWTVLEANTKGFAINRLTIAQINAIPSANLVEGMMVYDTTNKCLKLYTTENNGATFVWKCLTTQTCPD